MKIQRLFCLSALIPLSFDPCPHPAFAQMTTPTVREVRPLGLGRSGAIEVRGTNLSGASILFDDPKLLAENVEATDDRLKARISLPDGLAPGPRSFRVASAKGLSNPGSLFVGRSLPTVEEKEPNDGFRKAQPVAIPAIVSGEIRGGEDVDVFAVELKAGQTLVAEAIAARAGSGLDPLVTIFSPEGRELASDDDLFGRDAASWVVAPSSGRYLVQIQDANGRHRDGAFEGRTTRPYLLAIGEFPLILGGFPGGGRRGSILEMNPLGIHLPEVVRLPIPADVPPGDFPVRLETALGVANGWTVRVGEAPEYVESSPEPADDPLRPTIVPVPAAINGRFSASDDGDVDYFRLLPASGESAEYAVTVLASRIGSAADPVVAVVDERGKSQGEDDDKLGRDARIERRIGPEGIVIAVREYFGRGGPRFSYRIEVEAIPKMRVKATADLGSRTIPRRGALAIPIELERREFDGPVTVMTGPLPPGLSSAPVTIPSKAKAGAIVVSADDSAAIGPFPFRLVVRDVPGTAEIAYRERGHRSGPPKPAKDGKPEPAEGPVDAVNPVLAVAESAPLGISADPGELTIPPGGEGRVTFRFDRRVDPAKGKPLKARLISGDAGAVGADGSADGLLGFEPLKSDHFTPADWATQDAVTIRLKARPDAPSRRIPISVRVWFEGQEEANAVDGPAVWLIVP